VRILHVTPSFYPAWAYGGIPRCAYELCRSLTRLGEEVTVWTTDALDETCRVREPEQLVDGIRVRYFSNLSNSLAYHRQLYLPRGVWAHARQHLAEFDVIHVHSHRHLLQHVVWAVTRQANRPYVFTGNGTVPRIERYKLAKRVMDMLGARAFLLGAAACIAVSDAEILDYEAMGVAPRRIAVIPNGLPLEAFDRLPAPGTFRRAHGLDGAALVVFVGKITPRKGLDVLVRALGHLPQNVHLAVAGNFMMPEEPIRRLVRDLGLADRVRFAGLLVEEEKLAAYVDADVVAYPSVNEIFGLVAGEALLCGAPVVVCDDSGCGQMVRAAGAGLVVPYGEPVALARALQTLLEDRPRREQCVANGRRFVTEHLGWDRIARQTQALYEQVVQNHRTEATNAKTSWRSRSADRVDASS
jgi:glycosyltransferase involved in cell wall biosynthesis